MTARPIPYRYNPTHHVVDVSDGFNELPPDVASAKTVRLTGRVVRRRSHGRVSFLDVADATGAVQLLVDDATEDGTELTGVPVGTWIGICGVPMRTRRGELSVHVRDWVLLARCDRGLPDPRHGLRNSETQLRTRYLDFWARPHARDVLTARFRLQQFLRTELWKRDFMEVETPILQHVKGGASARPFTTHHNALDVDMTLRVAPELDLKRLVVGGFERVFEMGRVFRNEGLSTRHNPEFTSIEIYQAFADYQDMMVLTEQLVAAAAMYLNGTTILQVGEQKVDLAPPWQRVSMLELVDQSGEAAGLGPVASTVSDGGLRALARRMDVEVPADAGPGRTIAEIYDQRWERALVGPVFVKDYPREVSPLARRHRDNPFLAERFEAVIAGTEIANAYTELQDPDDQEAQLRAQAEQNAAGDDEAMLFDSDYVNALRFGLPPTGGLGIGVDRLAMFLTGATTIRDVIAFPALRPI